jgi:hypothetical protein
MSRVVLLAVLLLAELSVACSTSSSSPSGPTPTPTAAAAGTLQVGVASGNAIPETGFTVTVDGAMTQTSQTNASVTFTGLSAGEHMVGLSLYSTRCSTAGENPRKVMVVPGATVTTEFEVMCSIAAPATQPTR